MDPQGWPVAVLGATAIASVSWRLRLLTAGGAAGAAILGAVVWALGGVAWMVPLLLAFLSSSLLGRWSQRGRRQQAERGECRDLVQVAANGGVALLMVLGAHLIGGPAWYPAYVAAWSALAADSWATAIGGRCGGRPRLLGSFRPVDHGRSGGVTVAGTLAAIAGAATVAGSALWWMPVEMAAVVAGAGVVGMLVDSLLGAWCQPAWRCPVCQRIGDGRQHCGQEGVRQGGWRWMTNDVVNACGIAAAVALAWAILA